MVELAKKYKDRHSSIKDNIDNAQKYFEANYKRFFDWKRFLYVSSIEEDIEVLKSLNKPQLEFNILEAYVSRQKGEFAKQEPAIKVSANEMNTTDPRLIPIIEGYIRHLEHEMRNGNEAYRLYDDILSGSFSVARVGTRYTHDMSFEQELYVDRAFDPTLCGFDPMAKKPHKGDGKYAYEIHAFREEAFKEYFSDVDTSKLKFSNNLQAFNWSYKNAQNEKIILVADYYEKVEKRTKIVKLTNKQIMTEKRYLKLVEQWQEQGRIEVPPQIVEERFSMLTTIDRYNIIEDQVIKHESTDYLYLPLVFFDGDSVEIRKTLHSPIEQITRPYCYQARGVQRLKNFCGQTLANEIENMIQHKFKVSKQSIPPEFAEAYTNYQTPRVMVYNEFLDNDPEVRLTPPQEIQRIPTPPEVIQTFMGADKTTQAILGSYDAALGINDNQLSGVAIQQGANQSNIAAMPFRVGYLNGLQQIANILLDLIPKYLITPQTIPVLNGDGEVEAVNINSPGSPKMSYDPNSLKVKVTAGMSFAMQQDTAVKQITALMQASESFNEFINETEEGLSMILDNLDMRGIERLKGAVKQFMMQKMQAAQQQKPDPAEQALQIEVQNNQQKNQIAAATVAIANKNADTNRLKVIAGINGDEANREMEADKLEAEKSREATDILLKAEDLAHSHAKERIETAHKILKEQE